MSNNISSSFTLRLHKPPLDAMQIAKALIDEDLAENIEQFEGMLKRGLVSATTPIGNGENLITYAVRKHALFSFSVMVCAQAGEDPAVLNGQDRQGNSVWHHIALHLDDVNFLAGGSWPAELGALLTAHPRLPIDWQSINHLNETPLDVARRLDKTHLAAWIQRHMNGGTRTKLSVPADDHPSHDLSALQRAIEAHDMKQFLKLTRHPDFDINAQNERGDTAIHCLARNMPDGFLMRSKPWADALSDFFAQKGAKVEWALRNKVHNTAVRLMDIHHRTKLLAIVAPFLHGHPTDNGDEDDRSEDIGAARTRLRAQQGLAQTKEAPEKFLGKKRRPDGQ